MQIAIAILLLTAAINVRANPSDLDVSSFLPPGGWVVTGHTAEMTAFIQWPSVRFDHNVATFWEMYNYNTPRLLVDVYYASIVMETQTNCKSSQTRTMNSAAYAEPMQQGTVVFRKEEPSNWSAIYPNSVGEMVKKAVCANRKSWTK